MLVREITACRSCGSTKLDSVLDLGNLCVSDFPAICETDDEDRAPLELMVCDDCSLVQLRHTVDRDRLYRDYLVARCNEPVTQHDDLGAGRHSAWLDALTEYDATAPDRERAAKALALVESLTVTGRRCPENCILQPSCYYLAEGGTTPCEVLRGRCIQLGILPPEEAK